MLKSPDELQKKLDLLNEYSKSVREMLLDYYAATLRAVPDEDELARIGDVWTTHLIKARVKRKRLMDVYERAMLKSDFITVPILLRTWSEMQEEAVHSETLAGKALKKCTICHGTGIAKNYNFDTKEDEEMVCVCRQGV
jgi:hypothetical protein